MASIMFRDDWQKLARLRVKEARKLLVARFYPGAYYLSGYAVECAIKACIAKRTREYQFPDPQIAKDCFDHNLTKLLGIAELTRERDIKGNSEPKFDTHWTTVKDWKVESRYKHDIARIEAMAIYSAVVSRQYGVLQWLRKHW